MRLKSIFNPSGGRTYVVKRSKNKSEPSAIESTVSEYVQKSTIHGVAYVGDDERNKFERIWWFIMLVCSVFGACYLIYQAYRTMKENPIIESPSLTRIPMWDVPFPAVTFCAPPELKLSSFASNKTNWPDFTHYLLPDNLTDMVDDYEFFHSSLILETLLLRRSDEDNYDILSQILPEVDITVASFGTFPTQADVSFQNVITHHGPCVTFNMYQEKDLLRDGVVPSTLDDDDDDKTEQLWSRDFGFNNNLPLDNYTYPFRSFGPSDALFVLLDVNYTNRFSRYSDTLVSFHAPDEIPLFNRHAEVITIIPGRNNYIEITANLVVSESIEHYKPEVRQCYYSNERHLKYFKNYTQSHCERECIGNYILTQCGCIPYYYPHFSDVKLCTTDFECYVRTEATFFKPTFKDGAKHAPIDDCNCLPSCTQLSYVTVRTSTTKDGNDGDETTVFIRNKYPELKVQVRSELHSISEFFSNCGGSLGLFLGVSIFSVVELLYFCTVRLYLHSKRRSSNSNE